MLLREMLRLALLLAAAAALGAHGAAAFDAPWKAGRATYYSAPGDTWTIHDGSCTHKYMWPDIGPGAACCRSRPSSSCPAVQQPRCAQRRRHPAKPPALSAWMPPPLLCRHAGWDAGAISDTNDEFIGSCGCVAAGHMHALPCWPPHCRHGALGVGARCPFLCAPLLPPAPAHLPRRCYEIRCDPRTFTDGYGAALDRTSVSCRYDPQASVVMQIVVRSWGAWGRVVSGSVVGAQRAAAAARAHLVQPGCTDGWGASVCAPSLSAACRRRPACRPGRAAAPHAAQDACPCNYPGGRVQS